MILLAGKTKSVLILFYLLFKCLQVCGFIFVSRADPYPIVRTLTTYLKFWAEYKPEEL